MVMNKNLWFELRKENPNNEFVRTYYDFVLNNGLIYKIDYLDNFSTFEMKFEGLMDSWGEEHCLGNFLISPHASYFQLEEDKIKFILRWL